MFTTSSYAVGEFLQLSFLTVSAHAHLCIGKAKARARHPAVKITMAIFSLNHSFVARAKGQNSVGSAAYLARESLTDRLGRVFDYSHLGGLLHAEIAVPKDAPDWCRDRQALWHCVETREDKTTRPKDAQLAHSFRIALPHELTLEQNIWLMRDYLREQFTRHGYVADWAIHAPDKDGDQRNYHAHVMVTMRPLVAGIFSESKWRPEKSYADSLKAWRSSWSKLNNRHLKRHGIEAKIDHRTLKEQGIDREPGKHLGPVATALERQGKISMRGTLIRAKSKRSGGSTGGQGEGAGAMGGSVASAFKFHAGDLNLRPMQRYSTPPPQKSTGPPPKNPSPAAGVPFERRVRNATVPTERRKPTI